jgi:polygalacturonase
MKNDVMQQTVLSVSLSAGLSVVFGCCLASAQDTRNVTEPVIPPVCVSLDAQLSARQGLAAADEVWLDTDRIQAALDHCGQGNAVELSRSGDHAAFLSGPLVMRKGVTLLLDKGVTLYASRDPKDYEVKPGSCGVVNGDEKKGCRPLILAKHVNNAGVMGDGVIDGRGGSPLLTEGREEDKTWWDLAEDARDSGHQQVPRLIDTDHSDNFTVYRVTLKNSANVHIGFHNGNGLTVWGVKIDTPRDARNADGVDPSGSKNITLTESYIRAGDDNVAIKAGSGATRNVSILHNHFYWGHGMSIGSETNGGVSSVLVSDLSLDGPDNGIRIKSNADRGGLVKGVTYEDVCIRKSKAPIMMETAYSKQTFFHKKEPVYQDIVMRNVRISGAGKVQLLGLDESHRIGVRFDGVVLADPKAKYKFAANHADIQMGPGPVNFQLPGSDDTVRGMPNNSELLGTCDAKFVPYPVDGARAQEPVAAK